MDGNKTPSDYIELDRRFEKVERADAPELSALRSYTTESLFGKETGLSWADLLEHHLVVVLGEPGSGKTWEFRERAKLLRAKGEFAFFIRLDQLITLSFEEALGADEYRRFKLWLRGDREATFLLDSVDEAKFRRQADFYSAIDRFANAPGTSGLMGAKIFLSSRISEWQPSSDAHEVLIRLRVPPEVVAEQATARGGTAGMVAYIVHPTRRALSYIGRKDHQGGPEKELLVVHLQALDRQRVERFAHVRGVREAKVFVKALDDHHAWEFARRPLDIVGLLEFWQTQGRLGSLSEMVEFDLSLKLRASERDRNDPLSPAEAREGSEALGAATAFCRQFTFKVPDDAFIDTGALDASACLPAHWQKEQASTLLNRATFDSASYGQVRFHHRRIAEYLAAEWLAERMQQGCSKPELKRLLFDFVTGELVIRPSLAPVTAWLCRGNEPWNSDVRNWVLDSSPAIHLRFGDPASLPLEYRRRLLYALMKQAVGRERIWVDTAADALSRLADPALTGDVSTIINDRSISQDLRSEMIQMVRYGRLTECLATLLHIVQSPDELDALKSYAAAAIRDIGDEPTRRRLVQVAQASATLSNHVCGLICEAAYPNAMTAQELVALLKKVGRVGRHVGDIPYHLKHHFETALDADHAGELLDVLIPLAQTPPYIDAETEAVNISQQFHWLGEILPSVLQALMLKPGLSENEIGRSAEALLMLGKFRHYTDLHDEKLGDLNVATNRHSKVRQVYFWLLVDEYRLKDGQEPSFFSQLFGYYEVLRPISEDFCWLANDIQGRKSLQDRELALRLAFGLTEDYGNKRKRRQTIRQFVQSDASLSTVFRQLVAAHRFFSIRRFWYQKVLYRFGQRWWWQRKLRFLKSGRQWFRSQWILLTHLRRLASGDAVRWLADLSREADKERNHRWAPDSWDELRKKRGRLVTWAAKEGCKRAWTKFFPPLPHEEVNPNQTDLRVMVGLSGLQAEALDGQLRFPT